MPEGDRTYPPSATLLRQARARGDVAKSRTLTAAVAVAAGAGALALAGPRLADTLRDVLSDSLSAAQGELTSALLLATLSSACARAATAAAPLVFVPAAAAVAASLAQTGPILSSRRVAPSLARLNPRAMLFNGRAGIDLLRGAFAVVLTAAVFWAVVRPRLTDLAWVAALPPDTAPSLAWRLTFLLATWLAGSAVLLGGLDYLYQRRTHRRALRMTRAEWLRALREDEGDPFVRAARRGVHRELTAAELPAALGSRAD